MSASADDKRKPPYLKYAFSNPYNYAIMMGFASASLLTQNWFLGLVGAGFEAIWMLFAPDSKLLQRAWFDKRFDEETAAARLAEMQQKLRGLPEGERLRCMALGEQQDRINRLAEENPSFTIDLLTGELKKLDDLCHAFLELSLTCSRYEEYLKSVDVDEIERDIRRHEQICERSEGDKRVLAQKNLAVLQKRKEKYAEIRGYLSSARGQLELIENSFRLLADQIVTMRSPRELGGQLDELLDGVEAVRQTARETDRLLQAVEH